MSDYAATLAFGATCIAWGAACWIVHRVWLIVVTVRGSMIEEQKRIAEWNAEAKADGERMANEAERLRG